MNVNCFIFSGKPHIQTNQFTVMNHDQGSLHHAEDVHLFITLTTGQCKPPPAHSFAATRFSCSPVWSKSLGLPLLSIYLPISSQSIKFLFIANIPENPSNDLLRPDDDVAEEKVPVTLTGPAGLFSPSYLIALVRGKLPHHCLACAWQPRWIG